MKRKILVATTIYGDPRLGTVKYAYHQAVARLVGNADLDFAALPAGVQADIVRARSGIVRDALVYAGGTASGIFWLDEDVVAPAEVLGSLLTKLLDSGHDYCGVPYPKKRLHWDRVIEWFRTHDRAPTGAELAAAAFDYAATVMEQTEADKARGDGTVELPVVGGFAKVDRLGLGFTYTSRACLERMVRCYSNPNDSMGEGAHIETPTYLERVGGEQRETVALFQLLVRNRVLLTDDYSFCERWRAIGGEIHMWAGKSPLQHVGAFAYGATEGMAR